MTTHNENSGRAFFAATMAVLGIVGLIRGDFTQIWRPSLGVGPLRGALVWLSAIVSLGCGIGLLWRRVADAAARVLLAFSLAWLLLLRVPQMIVAFAVNTWWAGAQTAAMAGAAWILYVALPGEREGRRPAFASGAAGLRVGRALYGLALIPFGIAHFLFLAHTASMVPSWLPWHVAWAWFFGATFIVAGLAIASGTLARLAATLMAVQLALFTALVWVPVISGAPSASDWGEFTTSWALAAAAWVVADSYRGRPWVAARQD